MLKSPIAKLSIPTPSESIKKPEIVTPSTSTSSTNDAEKITKEEPVENKQESEAVAAVTTPKKTDTKVEVKTETEAKVENKPQATTSTAISSTKPTTPIVKEKSENLKKDEKQIVKPSQSTNKSAPKTATPVKKAISQNALRSLISTEQSLKQDPNKEYK